MERRYVKFPHVKLPSIYKGQGRNGNTFRSESTPPFINASQKAFRPKTGTELPRNLKKLEEEVDACRKQLLSHQRLISRLKGTLKEKRREILRLETENAEREKRAEADDGEVLKELAKARKELKETEDKLKEKNSELINAAQRIDILQKENKEKDEVLEEEVDAYQKHVLSQQRWVSRLFGTLNEQRRQIHRLKTENVEWEKRAEAGDGEVLKELAKARKELKETEDKLKETKSELISAAQKNDILQKENKEKDEVISELQSQLKMLHSKVDEQQTTINEMTEKLRDYTETKSEFAAIREQLKEVMAFQNSSNHKNV